MVGSEILYDGDGKDVEWIACRVTGGENMKIPCKDANSKE